ncbi:MAG: MupA/Atu3671 family FMN-dependent luciferase-like monooxygenase [Synechococcales bacterium]|nr:MupA/Atu3671 family FMN-dependent luciferase-like monooxygenase [Synechococcales bacterium]
MQTLSPPTPFDPVSAAPSSGLQLGLMFFSSGEHSLGTDRYRLVLDSATFADQHGFSSIWVPERHFTSFGCLYPNPAVLQAALARETQRIRLHAGSVVLPLNDPMLIAEAWSMVDNLSGGRVGVSFASGWNPGDFALAPEHYTNRHQVMFEGIETVRKLWRGDVIQRIDGKGNPVSVRMYPTPIQPELPIWVTAAGSPQTFIQAGAMGANLLTHLFDQTVDTLAEKLDLYRRARADNGYDPNGGHIAVTLHTFVGKDLETVRSHVQTPYCDYLKSYTPLLAGLSHSRGLDINVSELSDQDLDALTKLVFNKMFDEGRVLFGTPESCLGLAQELYQIGVSEVACMVDFNPDVDRVLQSLPYLNQLREACAGLDKIAGQTVLNQPAPIPLRLADHPRSEETNPDASASITAIQKRCTQTLSGTEFYQQIQNQGIELDLGFQGIEQLWYGQGEALGEVKLPKSVQTAAGYGTHPVLLDACLQVFWASLPRRGDLQNGSTAPQAQYLPVGLGELHVYSPLGEKVWSYAQLTSSSTATASAYEGNVQILDDAGQLLVEIKGLQVQQAFAAEFATGSGNTKPPTLYPSPDYLLSPTVVSDRLQDYLIQHHQELGLDRYQIFLPQLEALSADYTLQALHQLGVELFPGCCFATSELIERYQIVPQHQRLFGRLLQILQEHDILQLVGIGQWEVQQVPAAVDPQTTVQALRHQYPDCVAELDLLSRCGQSLADVLRGECDPLQLLFPDGSLSLVERLYQDSPAAKVMNQQVQRTIMTALENCPPDRAVRILEIGAGTGGTTAFVLPQLGEDTPTGVALRHRTEYVFTDISPLFTAQAAQKFAAYPFVTYETLNIEQEPHLQGFETQSFDIVLAANVLHATTNLQQTMNHVQELLVPGGLLVLLEGMQPQAWLDLTFGLTTGWWQFEDHDLRPDYPLLTASQWQSFLQKQQYTAVEVVGLDPKSISQQAIVIATHQQRLEPKVVSSKTGASHQQGRQEKTQESIQWLQELEALPIATRHSRLTDYVQTQVADIMGLTSLSELDYQRGLFELGMDSLMALELKNRLETTLGRTIPAVAAFEHPTVIALSTYLATDILGWPMVEAPAEVPTIDMQTPQISDDPLAAISQLSEAEVERLLAEKIAR